MEILTLSTKVSNVSLEITTKVLYGSSKTIRDYAFLRTLKSFPFIIKVCDMSAADVLNHVNIKLESQNCWTDLMECTVC
jgi:hypothetical protein